MRFFVRLRTRLENFPFSLRLLEFPFSFSRDLEGAASGWGEEAEGEGTEGGGGGLRVAIPLQSIFLLIFYFEYVTLYVVYFKYCGEGECEGGVELQEW